MKILLLSTYSASGGAAIAAVRLLRGLRERGHDARLLSMRSDSSEPGVIPLRRTAAAVIHLARAVLDRLVVKLYPARKKMIFSPHLLHNLRLRKAIHHLDPDVVCVQWTSDGFMSLEDLREIRIPLVFTMHDSWIFTGGCHVPRDCGLFVTGCGNCPLLASGVRSDLSAFLSLSKQLILSDLQATFVGVSSWVAQEARRSKILKGRDIRVIGNPIRLELDRKSSLRRIEDMVSDFNPASPVVLFGSSNSTGDPNKGYPILKKALESLSDLNFQVLVFGSRNIGTEVVCGRNIRLLGTYSNPEEIVSLYCGASVMVVPSLSESFGLTAAEAMACGVPVVAFRATGLVDIVDHKQNGYLAEPFDPIDLARGIRWILEHPEATSLGYEARVKITERFSVQKVASEYEKLFLELKV